MELSGRTNTPASPSAWSFASNSFGPATPRTPMQVTRPPAGATPYTPWERSRKEARVRRLRRQSSRASVSTGLPSSLSTSWEIHSVTGFTVWVV